MTTPLSKAERERFAQWLEQEASDYTGLVGQMKLLPSIPAQFIKNREYEIECHLVVARKLRLIQEESI